MNSIIRFCVSVLPAFLFSLFAGAQPDLSKIQPKAEWRGNEILVLPPADHHFNLDAPNSIAFGQKKLSLEKSEQKLQAKVSSDMRSVEIKTFICDEKKSYCVERNLQIKRGVAGKSRVDNQARSMTQPKTVPGEASTVKSYYDSESGFWVNSIDEAFAEAKQKKLPLLLDFYGIWCPPCNQLDFQVFSDKGFSNFLKAKFVGLKLDSDAGLSKALMKRYNIRYFPTLVATTSDGDEILRVLGFREKEALIKTLAQAYDLREKGQAKWAELAEKGDLEAKAALGSLALEREDFEEALKQFSALEKTWEAEWKKDGSTEFEKILRARYGAAKSDEEKLKAGRAWIQAYPGSLNALLIYDSLADLLEKKKDSESARKILEDSLRVITEFEKKAESEFQGTDFTKGDLYVLKASTLDRLENKTAAQQAYEECNKYFLSQLEGKKGFGRGEELNRAYCLRKQGKLSEAEALYQKGMKLFPQDFTFFLGHGRLKLEDAKDLSAAEESLRRALELAYGNQRIRTSIYLTRTLEAQKRLPDALKVVLKELSLIADPREMGYERLKKRMTELETAILPATEKK